MKFLYLQVVPTQHSPGALPPKPLAGTVDFHCTEITRSSAGTLSTLQPAEPLAFAPRQSRDAGVLPCGAGPFSSPASRSCFPAWFSLSADWSTTAWNTNSYLPSGTLERRVFPWPYIPSNYRLLLFSLPFSQVSHQVDYTRVCFPTSYLPFILKFNPASSLPEGLLSPFSRCLTFCTSNSGVSLGPSSTRIQLPTRCFPWSR